MRGFIDSVEPDPTHPLWMQLGVSPKIPFKDIQSDDVDSNEISTLIRSFNGSNQVDHYQPWNKGTNKNDTVTQWRLKEDQ